MLLGGTPDRIDIFFYGALARTFRGHMSDEATVGGLMGLDPDSPDIGRAIETARGQGIPVEFHPLSDSDRNPNTIDMAIERDGVKMRAAGISVGGGEILIDELDGFEISLRGCEDAVLVRGGNGFSSDEAVSALEGVRSVQSSVRDGEELVQCITSSPAPEAAVDRIRRMSGVIAVYPVTSLLPYKLEDPRPLFTSFSEVLDEARRSGKPLHELAVEYESRRSGYSRSRTLGQITTIWSVMRESLETGLRGPNKLIAGFTSGTDASSLMSAMRDGRTVGGAILTKSVARSIAAMEVNASMGRVAAAPTAGSCGVVPATLLTVAEDRNIGEEGIVNSLLVAAMTGLIIARRAPVSGALGGCQSEIGVASAMAAAGLVHMAGGSPAQVAEAVAMSLKNILGLICDPVAGPVEIPCIKRNSIGVANALASADMALAGIASAIPVDEVIDALVGVQKLLPPELRGTMKGGLGSTPTGLRLKDVWMERLGAGGNS
jgi:L-serine dehydratase